MNKHHITISEKAPDGDVQRVFMSQLGKTLPVAVIETNAKLNGTQTMTDYNFVRRFTDQLRKTGIFSGVTSDFPIQMPDRAVIFTLSIEESSNPNIGKSIANIFLGFISYGFLLLFLHWRTDFSSSLVLSAKRWDGVSRIYHANGKGIVKRDLFANHSKANTDLVWEVTNNSINSLLNQIVTDANFYI